MRAAVKTLIALALLAAPGFAVAGCGSSQKAISSGPYVVTLSKKAESHPVQINGTVTIPHLLPFHRVKCSGWPGRGVQVPPRGGTANVGRGKATPSGRSSSKSMQVTHLEDGSVIVSCKQSR
jgi:hypothetical protein